MVNKQLTIIACVAAAFLLSADSVWSLPQEDSVVPTVIIDEGFPSVLSQADRQLYSEIFRAQRKGDWVKADTLIAQLSDKTLMGHVLAERYLHHSYKTHSKELTAWLDKYDDHPQANAIYNLAGIAPAHRTQLLQGYGDDNGLAAHASNTNFALTWHTALLTWRAGDKKQAAALFSNLARNKDICSWQTSAAAYWAYRSYSAIGSKTNASKYLHMAAEYPRSFYGILAKKQLGGDLNLDSNADTLSQADILEMIGEPAVRRAVALASVGMNELAENELRATFPTSDEKPKLLALAHMLRLSSVEMSMASQLKSEGRTLDYARYPIPDWKPHGGFTVDPALIYALVRQESGFHANAINPSGASGVMQLMPKTASLMRKDLDLPTGIPINDLVLNVTLGQNYVERLLDNELVDGNLVYMLVAYNAGPGRLKEWKQSVDQNDPLLFMESIPIPETKHYVMQVMANYWIYSELTGKETVTAKALMAGKWPNYTRHLVAQASARHDG